MFIAARRRSVRAQFQEIIMKKISWATKGRIISNTIKVTIPILLLAIIFPNSSILFLLAIIWLLLFSAIVNKARFYSFIENSRNYSEPHNVKNKRNTQENKYVDKLDNSEGIHHAKVLGIKGKVSKSEIKNAYHEQIKQYHPDKVQHLGKDLRDLATVKSKEIIAAYGYFKSKYNIK